MYSIKSVFLVTSLMLNGYNFQQNTSIDFQLTKQFCNETDLTVDSIGRPYGKGSLFLIAGNYALKMTTKSISRSVIEWIHKLDYWSPDIVPPITLINTIPEDPNYIKLINCNIQKEWIISYEGNQYNGSNDRKDCITAGQTIKVEEVVDTQNGVTYLMHYYAQKYDMVIGNFTKGVPNTYDWLLRAKNNNNQSIRAILHNEEVQLEGTHPFDQLNGILISSAFIEHNYWYLIAGRFYCITKLWVWDACKPKLITDWINDCDPNLVDPSLSTVAPKEVKTIANKDISFIVLIVVVITAVSAIIIVLIVLLIRKEYKKKSTYFTQSSGSGSFTTSSVQS